MLVIAAILLLVFATSLHSLRVPGAGPRWPFIVAATLSGGAILATVMATGIVFAAGRNTWNNWVSGSASSETVTLWLVLVVGPVLLATCCALLIIGAFLRTRQRHRSHHTSSSTT